MSIVTIDTGDVCSGGAHLELIIKVDDVESYREWVEIADVLGGGWPSFQTVRDGANAIVSDTKAPNVTAWSALIKSKSVEVPDGIPVGKT